MPINENTLEQAVIAQLQENGYEYLYGPDIDRDYHEVISFIGMISHPSFVFLCHMSFFLLLVIILILHSDIPFAFLYIAA